MDQGKCIFVGLVLLLCLLCNAAYNLNGKPGEGYYINVLIGQPPQSFNVLVDTGSTNFAVAAAPAPSASTYFNTSRSHTYKSLKREVSVLYTQGSWKGELGNDIIQFPSLATKPLRCDLCAIKTSHDFFLNGSQWQGILGLAYPAITQPDTDVLSWLESLNKTNDTNIGFTLELCGPTPNISGHEGNFNLLQEGDTATLFSPIIREWFYELILTGIEIGNETLQSSCRELNTPKTIIDSGTTNLRLPEPICNSVLELLMKQVPLNLSDDFWKHQSPFCVDADLDLHLFPVIKLSLLRTNRSYFTLELPPQSYVRRVYDLNPITTERLCYKLGIETSGAGVGTVLARMGHLGIQTEWCNPDELQNRCAGAVLMEGFVVSFNRRDGTVGFNTSNCGPSVTMTGPFNTSNSLWDCRYVAPSSSALWIAGYVVSGLLCLMAAVLLYCAYGVLRKNTQTTSPTNSFSLLSNQSKPES